jgi:hypothetical protein
MKRMKLLVAGVALALATQGELVTKAQTTQELLQQRCRVL